MRKFKFAKLVRDKIVDQIVEAGNKPNWRTMSDQEYIEELKKKLLEEAQELPAEKNDDLINELADIQEIMDKLLMALNIKSNELKAVQVKKNTKAGSFDKKLYVEDVETSDNSEWVNHYLASPEKYPEIK